MLLNYYHPLLSPPKPYAPRPPKPVYWGLWAQWVRDLGPPQVGRPVLKWARDITVQYSTVQYSTVQHSTVAQDPISSRSYQLACFAR